MIRAIMPGCRPGLKASLAMVLLVAVVAVAPAPAMAKERLLRCVNAPVSIGRSHHRQHFAQHRLYAPVSSAMFFSHAGSACRWKSGQRRHG